LEDAVIKDLPLVNIINESKELSSLQRVYKLQGNPINVPFTDIQSISDKIFTIDLHSCIEASVEFGLGIHCVAYPGKFVSVWVFICSMVRIGI
jgi:coiled-coil and C2 domain-containing protein 2A